MFFGFSQLTHFPGSRVSHSCARLAEEIGSAENGLFTHKWSSRHKADKRRKPFPIRTPKPPCQLGALTASLMSKAKTRSMRKSRSSSLISLFPLHLFSSATLHPRHLSRQWMTAEADIVNMRQNWSSNSDSVRYFALLMRLFGSNDPRMLACLRAREGFTRLIYASLAITLSDRFALCFRLRMQWRNFLCY